MSQQATSPAFMSRHRWISHTQPLRITTMPRPPPLQLQFDNMFPGMVKSLLTGAYQSNWRMLVLCLATINALRLFFSASGAIDDLKVDLAQNNPALAGVSRTLATIYTIACGIELFGAAGAFLQRRVLIRAYAYLAFLSAALITGAGVVTTAAYFTFADELLRECVALATAGQLGSKSLFRGDPWPSTALSSSDAQTQCLDVWASESVSQVVSAAPLLPTSVRAFLPHRIRLLLPDGRRGASREPHLNRARVRNHDGGVRAVAQLRRPGASEWAQTPGGEAPHDRLATLVPPGRRRRGIRGLERLVALARPAELQRRARPAGVSGVPSLRRSGRG
ncbi:hypothetical protein B0H11DRAFT_192491 [Mycena galericulata]|nr:hypothetical protein B0H11DRAFT_192491 [Mycena galericulata]